jgi:putative tricarboxylic transport membrane protein
MELFNLLTAGLPTFGSPYSVFLVVAGSVLGIIFGGIPGLTATMGMAIFLPMTFTMSDINGMLFLIGIYVGACYAGSLTSILVNIPGTPSSIATGFDGYPMTQKGQAGQAIGYSTIAQH